MHSARHGSGHDLDSRVAHVLHEVVGQHRIEASQQLVEAHEHRHLAAKRPEDSRKLHGDVAAADDRHTLGLRLELEEPVRRDATFRAGERRHLRISADRDHDVIGTVRLPGLIDDFARPRKPAVREHRRNALVVEIAPIDAVQPFDVGIPTALQKAPVVTVEAQVEPVVRRLRDRVSDLGRVPHHFLRHATDIDAGPPQPAVLENRHARTVLGRALGGRETAAAATKYNQIERLHPLPSRTPQ